MVFQNNGRPTPGPHLTPVVVVSLAVALVLARILSGFFWPLPLQLDEAQYLGWSRDLALGYYSKPPMISWILAGNSHVCSAFGLDFLEACTRLSQPLALGLVALFSGLASWCLFKNPSVTLSSILLLITSPLFGFYSLFATTDAWLLLFWSAAFWLFVAASQYKEPVLGLWAGCGLCVGAGLLAKYSMAIFILSALIWVISQRRVWTIGPWIAAAIALLVFAPNLAWNAMQGFPTILHHAEISQAGSLGKSTWSFGKSLGSIFEFSLAQFLMIGPLALGWAIFRGPWRSVSVRAHNAASKMLLVFALPMLAVMLLQAFISRANANWAAPAFITLAIYVSWLWFGGQQRAPKKPIVWLWLSVFFGLSLSVVLIALPKISFYTQGPYEIRAIEKLRGWREAALRTKEIASENTFAILAEDRAMLAALHAYAPDIKVPIYAFDSLDKRQNHYTWFQNIRDSTPQQSQSILLLAFQEPPDALLSRLGLTLIRQFEDPTLQRILIGDGKMVVLTYELRPKAKQNGS